MSTADQETERNDDVVATTLSAAWWLFLAAGVAWIFVAMAILQFDEASVRTVGVIIGIMLLVAGLQEIAMGAIVGRGGWVLIVFGVLVSIGGIITLIQPEDTFAGVADILGFIFGVIAAFWILQAFASRSVTSLWWVSLVAGIVMLIVAFWVSGQFLIEKQYLLLVFSGIWALSHGLTDIVRAFELRRLREVIGAQGAGSAVPRGGAVATP